MSSAGERRIVVGRVSGLFGVRGWVKVHSHTRPPDNLLGFGEVEVGAADGWQPLRVAECRRHGKTFIARFEGVEDRDQAAGLVGRDLAVRRRQLPGTEPGEVYWVDLIGLEVVNLRGERLGRVRELIETGADDVMVLDAERERLVPFARDRVVRQVDLEAGRILVDWELDY